ncbi:MAG: hypothetical protein FIA92_12920 [Chloroflexi bacterium]|nr:hypothetical protein [Chloroflexota bacterium]
MPGPLFEQYKDALRRGHAALLDGRHEDAVEAYSAAARLVPDRALPHTSTAAAWLALGRRDEALAARDRAAALAPDDEATLRSRAGLLHELGRDAEAAADLERLAAVFERGARREEALRVARRAVDLAPTASGHELVARLEVPVPAEPVANGEAWPAIALPSRPSEPSGPPRDPELLVANAAERVAAGAIDEARDLLLEAVAVHRGAGRPDAALDLCFQLLEIAPGHPAVHLAIANVQLDRGWQGFAADKIRLLIQLTSLTGDTQAAADAHALAAERLRDEPIGPLVAG